MHYSVKELQPNFSSTLNSDDTDKTNEYQQSVSGKLQLHTEALPKFTTEHVME